MKKVLLFALAAFALTVAKSQDDNDKKFRFGLIANPSFNWLKVDDEKTFSPNGSVMKFGYGLLTEFRITSVAWFSTGFQVDYSGGKIGTVDTVEYYYNEDKGFLENTEVTASPTATATYTRYFLNSRNYNSMYLTIPLTMRLKTKEIGYLTYYGNFGLLTSIHVRTRANDNVTYFDLNSLSNKTTDLEKLDISKDMNFLNTSLVLGGGAEYNVSGSTSLIFGLSFNQGFLNTVKGDSKYLIDGEKSTSTTIEPQTQKFLTRSIRLTIGVLF